MGIYHMISERDIESALRFPLTSIGSDAGAVGRIGVPDATGLPHPRRFGNHVRVIARYVKEKKTLALEEAVRKMTSWPATRTRLADRGVIRVGAWAVVIDRGRHTGAMPGHVLRGQGWPPPHAAP